MRQLRVVTVLGILAAATPAAAQTVPYTVGFTGRLADANGPVNGAVDMTFRLFDAASAGTLVWEESHAGTPAQDGLVFATLGSTTPLDEGVLIGAPLFLEITVQGDVLSPRTVVVSVPYAVRAALAADAEALGGLAPDDYITAVTAGPGLTGGGAGGIQALAVAFGGSGSANMCARSDHDHDGVYLPQGTDLTCSGTDKVTGIDGTGSVVCSADLDTSLTYTGTAPISVTGTAVGLSTTGCVAGESWVWNGTAWACSAPPAEIDAVVGNEVADATNATLTRGGTGTSASPYTLALNLGSANTWTASQTFTTDTNFPTGVWTDDGTQGRVGINTVDPQAMLHVIGSTTRVGTGTVSGSSGMVTLTGSGTTFTTQLAPGDLVLSSGQALVVVTVVSDTSLTVADPLSADILAATFNFRKPTATFVRGTATPLIVNAANNVGINTVSPATPLDVAGVISSSGATTGVQVANPDNNAATASLSWHNPPTGDYPRIRWGGSGAGSNTGFHFQSNTDTDRFVILEVGDVFVPGNGRGLVLRSTGGVCYRLTVTDTGTLVTSPYACPIF